MRWAPIAATMTMEEIHEHRSDYIRDVKALVADSLTANGLELEAASLTNLDQTDMKLFNPSNAFDAEGMTRLTEEIETRKKKRNDIEQDTLIAIRAKNLEAEKLALTIEKEGEYARLEQEREVSVRRAQQRAEVALEKAERERDIEEAQIRAKEAIDRARIKHELAIDAEHIRAVRKRNDSVSSASRRGRNGRAEPHDRGRRQRGGEPDAAHPGAGGAQEEAQRGRTGDRWSRSAPRTWRRSCARWTIQKESEYARLEQDLEVEMRRAQQRAEVEREKAERQREIEEAKIEANEAVERARIKLELAIESEKIRREQETERLEILRHRSIEIEEQERMIAVAEKSKLQSEAQVAAETARRRVVEAQESVTSARERQIAERRKFIDLIDASQQAERNAIKVTSLAAAEKAAAVDHAEADKAAAEAARFRYDVDAEGKRKLNEAENLRSDASRRTRLEPAGCSRISRRSSARASGRWRQIESIKILQVDGLPGFSNGVPPGGGSGGGDGGSPRRRRKAGQPGRERGQCRDALPVADPVRRQSAEGGRNVAEQPERPHRSQRSPARQQAVEGGEEGRQALAGRALTQDKANRRTPAARLRVDPRSA